MDRIFRQHAVRKTFSLDGAWEYYFPRQGVRIEPDLMPADRYNLPNNERRRLQLHFSRNMIDWCFAGLLATGPVEKASRHYASMAINGNDLVVLSRSGDELATSPHDGNLITFHRVKYFRGLVY